MGEKTQNLQSSLLSNGLIALGTVVVLIFIYFQKWTDFWVMFFLWIPLGMGIWFLILGKIKSQMQLPNIPITFNPIGDERESGRLFLIFTLVNEVILLILGWDSVARYQLMDNYGFLYLIPFITIYNLVWVVWIFTVWQNTTLILKLPEDRVKILHRLDLIAIRDDAKHILIFFLIMELIVVIDIILANTVHWNMWMIYLRTPGFEIDSQGQIPLSGLVWILLGVAPIVSLFLMKTTFKKAYMFSLSDIFPNIEQTFDNKQDTRKTFRTLMLFQEYGPKTLPIQTISNSTTVPQTISPPSSSTTPTTLTGLVPTAFADLVTNARPVSSMEIEEIFTKTFNTGNLKALYCVTFIILSVILIALGFYWGGLGIIVIIYSFTLYNEGHKMVNHPRPETAIRGFYYRYLAKKYTISAYNNDKMLFVPVNGSMMNPPLIFTLSNGHVELRAMKQHIRQFELLMKKF